MLWEVIALEMMWSNPSSQRYSDTNISTSVCLSFLLNHPLYCVHHSHDFLNQPLHVSPKVSECYSMLFFSDKNVEATDYQCHLDNKVLWNWHSDRLSFFILNAIQV